jgi:hypothetical protein
VPRAKRPTVVVKLQLLRMLHDDLTSAMADGDPGQAIDVLATIIEQAAGMQTLLLRESVRVTRRRT